MAEFKRRARELIQLFLCCIGLGYDANLIDLFTLHSTRQHNLFLFLSTINNALFIVLKNKKDCGDVYCITIIELQAHNRALIQNI